jgi:transcriptional regulator of acetoin/glycerol metabolism
MRVSRSPAAPPARDSAAASRVRFLTGEPVAPGLVRGFILASWKRSRDLGVAADKVEQPYRSDPDIDIPLTRSAGPVLRILRGQLDGQPMSVILTDPGGLVLSRETGEGELDRYLERLLLAPGFSYAESFVGTNGIGTALEVGGPAHVFGH